MAPTINPLIPAGAAAVVDGLLARMRSDDCVVKRPTGSRSVGGAPVTTYATAATINCTVAAAGTAAAERIAGGRFGPDADFIVRVPRDTDIRSDDRIEVNGVTLEVIYAPTAASFGFQLEVLARATS